MNFTKAVQLWHYVLATQAKGKKEAVCVDQVIKLSLHTSPSVVWCFLLWLQGVSPLNYNNMLIPAYSLTLPHPPSTLLWHQSLLIFGMNGMVNSLYTSWFHEDSCLLLFWCTIATSMGYSHYRLDIENQLENSWASGLPGQLEWFRCSRFVGGAANTAKTRGWPQKNTLCQRERPPTGSYILLYSSLCSQVNDIMHRLLNPNFL